MEEKIILQLGENLLEILAMKKPTIMLNTEDLEILAKKWEGEVTGIDFIPKTYQGIPIKGNPFLDKGEVLIYDDVSPNYGCLKCSPNVFPNLRFNVCPICGNKR